MARKDKDVMEGRGSASVSLATLFPEARFVGADDIVASRCTAKADRCHPGDVFVARMDDDGDGHEEVARAIARGARAIVAERMIPSAGVPVCLVPDSAWALARLAHACCGDPGARLRIVAITGTSGKTTTAWLAASVLAEAGLTVGVLSDLGCLDAESCLPEAAELRDPEVVAAWLARLVASGCTDAVVEVSSEMLAAQVLAGVGCETVVVTNLASAHLDAHGTVEAYRAIKERILASVRPDGCLVFNADDRRVCRLADRHQGPKIAIGLQGAADVTARPVERSLSGQTVLVSAAGHAAAVSFDTPTAGFVRDALIAAAVGLRRRVPLERVARGLESAGSVPGRLVRIDRGQEATVFVDRASSGHAIGATLSSLRHLGSGRLILVADERAAAALGGARRFRGRVAKWCDTVVLVPANVLDEAPDEAASAAYARVDRLLAQAGPDDCVVVLDETPSAGGTPGDPVTAGPLVALVDGWLQLAHPPVWGGRRAA